MNFPEIPPTRISMELPEYLKVSQSFQTSDYFTSPTQFIGTGTVLNCEWSPADEEQRQSLRDFYDYIKNTIRFTLPSAIASQLPPGIIQSLSNFNSSWWTIDGAWNCQQDINGECILYVITLKLRSV